MGVTTAERPCWIVTHPDGSPTGFEDDEPHYATEAEARKFADDVTAAINPPLIVKKLDNPCSAAVTVCGYVYDQDEEGEQHWPDGAQAFQDWLTTHAGYRLSSGGELLCPLDHGCDECNALAPIAPPAELPGQMSIGKAGA